MSVFILSCLSFLVLSLFFFSFVLGFFSFSVFDWFVLNFELVFDFFSCLFGFSLFFIFFMIVLFSCYYLSSETWFHWYFLVLLLFLFSMALLCFSSSLFLLFIAWDGLGVTSFFLVLFYLNFNGVSGALVTVLSNRFGDFCLFWFAASFFFGSLSFLSFTFFGFLLFSVLIIVSFTKSAQFPFSAWLPKAMAAPTPVSALVHSSTLVTAGVFLLFKFSLLFFLFDYSSLVLFIGSLTILFSGFCALGEFDMKKVVALSTLSQMGFLMFGFGLGFVFFSFLHMVSHAFFKSLLFMQVGYILHNLFGGQDFREFGAFIFESFVYFNIIVCLLCLCGQFFTSGFLSKDFLLESLSYGGFSIFFLLILLVFIFLTFLYSYRLFVLFYSFFGGSLSFYGSSSLIFFFSCFLSCFSVYFLWFSNLNFFVVPSFLLFIDKLFAVFMLSLFLILFFLGIYLIGFLFQFTMFFMEDFVIYGEFSLNSFKFSDSFLLSFNLYLFDFLYKSFLSIYHLFFSNYSFVGFIGVLFVFLFLM